MQITHELGLVEAQNFELGLGRGSWKSLCETQNSVNTLFYSVAFRVTQTILQHTNRFSLAEPQFEP
jgi:hypothetical protein